MRKLWDIPGGVHPPEHKEQSTQLPIAALPLPPFIVLPVSQHIGAPAEPIVNVGDLVLKGQCVASSEKSLSAKIHASTSGVVTAIEERPLPHASGLSGLCIVIESDGKDEWIDLQPCNNYENYSKPEIIEKIHNAGIVGMGGAGFPSAIKLNSPLKISTLIINGTECEPYITSDDLLMQTEAEEIVRGIELLNFLLESPKEILIAIEDNKPKAIESMRTALANSKLSQLENKCIEVVPLPTKYPSGGEKQLVQNLTGAEIPSGKLPADIGITCQNVATVRAAYRAVYLGEPLISRVTTVTGNAFSTQQNVHALLGTPISFILEQQGYKEDQASRLVMGGPMMGFTLLNTAAPVVKTTNCLLAPTKEEAPDPGPAQACIRCGMCAEACPASLLPQQLYWYARAEDPDKLVAHNLMDCIECGACSYVCPSQIPLVQYYRASKSALRQHAAEKELSDRARERFEFHKNRVEQEKAERAKAREEAAAKAKKRNEEKRLLKEQQLLEEQNKAEPGNGISSAESKPNLSTPDTEASQNNELAKLERGLLSASDRVEKLKSKLAELGSSETSQADATRARIKESELKCESYREKIAALSSSKQDESNSAGDEQTTQTSIVNTESEALAKQAHVDPNKVLPETTESENAEPKTIDSENVDPDTVDSKTNASDINAASENNASDAHLSEHQREVIAKLEEQLNATQQKLSVADTEDEESIAALNLSINILTQRIESTRNQGELEVQKTLSREQENRNKNHADVSDAIQRAMEQTLTSNHSDMNDGLQQHIDSLQNLLHSAQEQLAKNPDASKMSELEQAVIALEEKLAASVEESKTEEKS
ncbi:electron transport complex subunit RsxC [Aurantivibrio infirmus]